MGDGVELRFLLIVQMIAPVYLLPL